MAARTLLVLLAASCVAWGQDKYTGPKPPKTDLPYLLHASNLIPTESTEAQQQDGKKDSTTYYVPGASSAVKTPLAEPAFILATDKLMADSLELYKFDVKNGRRELTLSQKRSRNGPRPYRLSVTRLGNGLYRLEASESLENGEYGLSPSGANKVFCFQVY